MPRIPVTRHHAQGDAGRKRGISGLFALVQGSGYGQLAHPSPHSFGSKKTSYRWSTGVMVTALAQVSGEETGEILPVLRDLHLPDGPGTSADIEPFIAARKLYGLPVSVRYKGLDWHDDRDSS